MKIRLLAPVLLAGALGLAACGGGSSSSDATIPADAGLVVTAIDGLKWDQATYTATAGKVLIAVENSSGQPHNFHVADADGTELAKALDLPSRGTVATETLDLAAGSYTVFCSIPGHSAMRSTLEVS